MPSNSSSNGFEMPLQVLVVLIILVVTIAVIKCKIQIGVAMGVKGMPFMS